MKYFEKLEKGFLGAVMLGTTVLLFTNVVLRYFFHSAIFWAEEVLRYMIVWIIFIGISTCVKERSHINVDILQNYGGPVVKKAINILVDLVGVLFGCCFFYFSIQFIIRIKASGQMAATLGNVPMYLIYLCLPISFFLYAVRSAANIVEDVRGKKQAASPADEIDDRREGGDLS